MLQPGTRERSYTRKSPKRINQTHGAAESERVFQPFGSGKADRKSGTGMGRDIRLNQIYDIVDLDHFKGKQACFVCSTASAANCYTHPYNSAGTSLQLICLGRLSMLPSDIHEPNARMLSRAASHPLQGDQIINLHKRQINASN